MKDLVAVAGVRTTGGSLLLNDWIPSATATAIQRLQQAGAIFIGKSIVIPIAPLIRTS